MDLGDSLRPEGERDQTGRLIEHPRDPDVVTRGDRSEERQQRIVEVIGSRTWLHHSYRLSKSGARVLWTGLD